MFNYTRLLIRFLDLQILDNANWIQYTPEYAGFI